MGEYLLQQKKSTTFVAKYNHFTTMQKFLSFLGLVSILVCFCACENTYDTFIGEYHYQSSGNVTLGGTRNLILDHEKGTLEIIQKDPTTLMLIFFAEDGSTYTTDATVEGNTITFNPFNKLLTVSYYVTESSLLGGTTNRLETEDYQVAVYGMGTIHSNAIVFTIQYNGEELTSGQKLVGNNITLIAKKKI